MTAQIPVTGFASDYRVPAIGMEIVFAQGQSISGAGSREILIVGPKLAAGTYTANTLYGPIKTESEVQTGGGTGGRLHRMARKFMQSNKGASVYILPYADTTGGSPAKAVGQIALSGSTSTADTTFRFWVVDEEISISIKTGDTPTTIGDDVAAAINGRTWLPVTATNTTGTIAITAKHFGTSGGNGTYNPLRLTAVSPGSGITAAVTEIGTGTAGAEGSTTETATLTTALAAVEGRAFYYYCYDNFANTTAMAALKTHIANKSMPRYGRRAYLISGYNGTLAAFTTIANGLNYERIECALHPTSYHDPAVLAAQLCATHQLVRETDPANGLIDYSGADWTLLPTPTASWVDEDDINDAIAAGASVVANKNGGTYLVMSLTTRSKDGSGTYADFRAAESHRISVADYCASDLAGSLLQFKGQGLKAHPTLPDGTPDPNAIIPRGVVTPFTIKPTYVTKINEWEAAGLTQNAAGSLASLSVVKSTDSSLRIESGFSLYARDNLAQITCRIAESSAA